MSGSSASVQNDHCHICDTVNSDGKVSGKVLPKLLLGGLFLTVQFLAGTLEVLLALCHRWHFLSNPTQKYQVGLNCGGGSQWILCLT